MDIRLNDLNKTIVNCKKCPPVYGENTLFPFDKSDWKGLSQKSLYGVFVNSCEWE